MGVSLNASQSFPSKSCHNSVWNTWFGISSSFFASSARSSFITPRCVLNDGSPDQYHDRFRSACNMSSFICPANSACSDVVPSASAMYICVNSCTESSAHGLLRSIDCAA